MMRIQGTLLETLTSEQVGYFNEHGYLHFREFLKPEAVIEVKNALDEVQSQWIEEGRTSVNGIPLKFGKDIDGSTIVQRMAFASQFHPVLHELLKDPRLKALLPLLEQEGRIGETEKDGMVVNHYVNHKNSEFTKMGWHTDAVRDVFYGKKVMPMLNVGIHLNDYKSSNGGLRLIPGTHKQGVFKMFFRKVYYKDNRPDPNEIGFDIKAGDLTLHDGRIWHRVAQSTVEGEDSRRRVIYVPFVTGKYQPKNEQSKMPIYHKFQHLVR